MMMVGVMKEMPNLFDSNTKNKNKNKNQKINYKFVFFPINHYNVLLFENDYVR